MTGLAVALAACLLYAAWLCRHLAGPFRPIRNELEAVLQQALVAGAVAVVLFGIGLDLKAKGGAEAPPSCSLRVVVPAYASAGASTFSQVCRPGFTVPPAA